MSTFNPASANNSHLSSATAIARRIVATMSDRRQNRREVRQLLEMDDRALKDIGLTRTDALGLAYWPDRVDPGVGRADPARIEIGPGVIEHHVRRAHALRGQAVAELGRGLARLWRNGLAGL